MGKIKLTVTVGNRVVSPKVDMFTKHGKPVMVTISYEQMESLLETLEILQDENFSNHLAKGITQAEQGETVTWDDAKTQLGW